jgi:hypothetical protein
LFGAVQTGTPSKRDPRCPDNLINLHFVDASCGRTGLDWFLDFIY